MTELALKRELMDRLIETRIELDAYLQLRKAKGYMSVSDNDHLRAHLFELCNVVRGNAALFLQTATPKEKDALRQAGEAIASAAVCLMSGHHDCPSSITVNVDTLERCLEMLSESIRDLNVSGSQVYA